MKDAATNELDKDAVCIERLIEHKYPFYNGILCKAKELETAPDEKSPTAEESTPKYSKASSGMED